MPACPSCGEENPERARFCLACATPLAPGSDAGEERKVVSVLFVDLVGFTRRSDRADPEDVRATLRPYHARVKREIERFGGTVEKFVGDAVMAVFGAPVSHEDDPERAVRAGLRILDAIGELNEHESLELTVRAAVDTGGAVVSLGARSGEGEGIATGDVVNTAARLQNVAPVGALVVGDATYRATRQAVEYEQLEPVSLKGKSEPVSLWLARGARSRLGVDAEAAPATPFVGREPELRLLQYTYERMLREAAIQLVTITGEPGVGKTRLLAEFRRWVDDRPEIVFWRQGRCLPYGEGITFWALGEIVKAHAGILESDDPDEAEAKLSAAVDVVVDEVAERDWLRARLAPLAGIEALGGAGREELFACWQQFLEAVASQRPLVVLLEDLHWADAPLIEFLEHLVDLSTGVPMLVLCSARPELYERDPSWGGGKRNSTTVSLSPLSREETARLISALLDRPVLPADTQAALLERSGGNPLYAEEFVRMLRDREDAGGAIQMPETIQALIAARLDTLPPERKTLLQDAAVIGKVFWTGALEAMGGEGVAGALRELTRKEFVRPARASSVEGETEYAFWHAIVRDVAYGQIPRAARAQKHRAAGEWIEGIAGERVADHADLLAHHYAEALELARAAGAEAEGDELRDQAVHFLVMAAERAMRLDVDAAERHYRHALSLLPEKDPARAAILARGLSRVTALVGRGAESVAAAEEAAAIARSAGDTLSEGAAMLALGHAAWDRGDMSAWRAAFEPAVSLLERSPPGSQLVVAYASRAGNLMHLERPEECIEWAEKAIALAEQIGGAEDQVVRARQFHGFALCELGRVGEGLAELEEALRLALEFGLGLECATAHVNRGDILWWTEGPLSGLRAYEDAADFAARRGLRSHERFARMEAVWTLYELGRWDDVLSSSQELIEWGERSGHGQLTAGVLQYRAAVLAWRGRIADAAELVPELLARAHAMEDTQMLMPALAFAAHIELARGDLESARRLAEEYEGLARERMLPRLTPVVARVALAVGARELVERLPGLLGAPMAYFEHSQVTCHAVAAEARGELEAAAAGYADAAERWSRYGFRLERGETLLGRGRCLLALGRADETSVPLREAHAIFVDLGAIPLLTEADGLLGQLASARSAR